MAKYFCQDMKNSYNFFEKAAAIARMMLHTLNPISFKIFMKKRDSTMTMYFLKKSSFTSPHWKLIFIVKYYA